MGFHVAKAAYHYGCHHTGEGTTPKAPSKVIFKEELPAFHLLNMLSALCQAHGKVGKTDEKDREKGLSGSFQCCMRNYS